MPAHDTINPLAIHHIIVGDTRSPLGVQLCDRSGSPVDLTSTTVTFGMYSDSATVISPTSSGVTVTEATQGKVEFAFSASHVATAGTYYGYFTVTSGGSSDTWPPDGRRLVIDITAR